MYNTVAYYMVGLFNEKYLSRHILSQKPKIRRLRLAETMWN